MTHSDVGTTSPLSLRAISFAHSSVDTVTSTLPVALSTTLYTCPIPLVYRPVNPTVLQIVYHNRDPGVNKFFLVPATLIVVCPESAGLIVQFKLHCIPLYLILWHRGIYSLGSSRVRVDESREG